MRVFLISCLLCGLCLGEVLRLSKVGKEGDPGVERMELARENEDGKKEVEVVYVFKEAIVTEKDVKFASPDPIQRGVINIRLTKAGGEKMIEATKVMKPGRDRIAIVLEGGLVSAPRVNSVPLGSSFMIEGFDDGDAEVDELARRLSGRPPRKEKDPAPLDPRHALKRLPATLKIVRPEFDPKDDEFDLGAYLEKVKIATPKQKVNSTDLGTLMTIAMIGISQDADVNAKIMLRMNSDLMLALGHNFPEVAALGRKAKDGKVSLKRVQEVLVPYSLGGKIPPKLDLEAELQERAKAGQGGMSLARGGQIGMVLG